MEPTGPDFIATELLKELKEENQRKDTQIKGLHKMVWRTIVAAFLVVVATIAGMLVYLYQYDFFDATYEDIDKSAEGFYAIIDNEGNVVGRDIPENVLEDILNGESVQENSTSNG